MTFNFNLTFRYGISFDEIDLMKGMPENRFDRFFSGIDDKISNIVLKLELKGDNLILNVKKLLIILIQLLINFDDLFIFL